MMKKNKVSDTAYISTFSAPEESLGYLLWCVSTRWRRSIEYMLKSYALTHPQFVVLSSIWWLIYSHLACTQSAISKMTDIDPNTVSHIVRGLEKRGLVVRAQGHDERCKEIELTDQSAQLLKKAMVAIEERDKMLFSVLSSEEQTALKLLFQRLLSSL